MPKDGDNEGSGFTGRRNKTFREIDANRGKSKYNSRQDDAQQQRIERSPTYERYKTAADALFTGGELPKGLAQTFDPEGKRHAQKDAMLKLRELPDHKAWVQGVVDFMEKFPELPNDAYFLDSLLSHPRDRVVEKALSKLESLCDGDALKGKVPKSLEQRLKSIELTSLDSEMQARAKALRERLPH